MSRYTSLFQPLVLNGTKLSNRLIMGSMHTGLEEQTDGYRRMAAFYAERAAGGAGHRHRRRVSQRSRQTGSR